MTGIMQMVLAGEKPNQYNWPVANIGDAYGGGYFGGQINISGTKYNLVVAPKSTGESSVTIVWGPTGSSITGAESVIDGPANTATLVALGSSYTAAKFCNDLNAGSGLNGHTDWYLPAKNELEVLYYYLKPSTAVNLSYGDNANAVAPEPISTYYTSSAPPQTSAASFIAPSGAQAFSASNTAPSSVYYWTSTVAPGSTTSAVAQAFVYGIQANYGRSNDFYVRAIRRVLA